MSSPVGLIERATSDDLLGEEDLAATMALVDFVNQSPVSRSHVTSTCLIKRLSMKSQNVILSCLKVLYVLYKNCGQSFSEEIASKAMMSILTRLALDRNIHEKIKTKISSCFYEWEKAFNSLDPTFHIIHETCQSLRSKGFQISYTSHEDVLPEKGPRPTDAQREQEDLQLALALSMAELDKQKTSTQASSSTAVLPTAQYASLEHDAVNTSPRTVDTLTSVMTQGTVESSVVKRHVKALYDFTAAEGDELSFKLGQIIQVTDDSHPDWWKGKLLHSERIALFPKSYTIDIPINEALDSSSMASRTKGKIVSSRHSGIASLDKNATEDDYPQVTEFVDFCDRLALTSTAIRYKDDMHLRDLYESCKEKYLPEITKQRMIAAEELEELENLNILLKQAIRSYNEVYGSNIV